ncbi:MAG: hypothetical protein KKB51_12950 [Candidatus Riflebacteria bacterium]|nr:hypothetical protein [Candidatus Riflebacteria bacterium]
MKKLFVLFLLVSLVPFTVGCSLWGGDDEAVTYPTFLTATVMVPAAGVANLRGVSYADFSMYKLTLNGIVLAVDEAASVFTTDPVKLVFKALATQAQVDSVQKSTVPFTAVLSNGTGTTTTLTINPSANTGVLVVEVNTAGVVTGLTVGGVDVSEYVGVGTFTVSAKFGATDLGTSATTNVTVVNTLTPTFIVELPDAITVTNGELPAGNGLSITTKNAAGVTVAITAADFTIAQGDAANRITVTVKAQAEPKALNNGTTYSVKINNLKNAGKVVVPATFYFKVTL